MQSEAAAIRSSKLRLFCTAERSKLNFYLINNHINYGTPTGTNTIITGPLIECPERIKSSVCKVGGFYGGKVLCVGMATKSICMFCIFYVM